MLLLLLLLNVTTSDVITIFVIADPNRALLDPDNLAKGVSFYEEEEELDTLMEFLARYVRVVHCNRFFIDKLFLNKGKSYVQVLTPSDIAFAICLLKNSVETWRHKIANNGDAGNTRPLFSAGEGVKREHGESTGSKEGIKYFKDAQRNWMEAFVPGARLTHILDLYWREWIDNEGKTYAVGDGKGLKTKSAHSILRTREKGETVKGAARAKKVVQPEEEEEEEDEVFCLDADDDNNGIIDVGCWSATKGRGRGGVVQEDNEDEDEDDERSEASNDNTNNKRGGNKKRDEDNEDEDADEDKDEDEDDGASMNGIQQMMEEEARVAGMTNRRGGNSGGNKEVSKQQRGYSRDDEQQRGKSSNTANKKRRFGMVVTDDAEKDQRRSSRTRVPKIR